MKVYIALAALVLLAGCTGGGSGLPATSSSGGEQQQPGGTEPISAVELDVYLSGLPEEVSGTKYFMIVAEAKEAVEDAKVFLYNLGSYLESSCSGTSSLGSMSAGQKKEISCS